MRRSLALACATLFAAAAPSTTEHPLRRDAAQDSTTPPLPTYARYVVLGAGPGGLQIAHYLESAGRDYLVLDAAAHPASFFKSFPRWRQLISINKAHVGRNDSLAFAERHDWNSLLSDASHSLRAADAAAGRGGASPIISSTDARLDVASLDASLRFTSWSDAYYPQSDALVDYIAAWTAAPGDAPNGTLAGLGRARPLRVRYNTTVVRVARPQGRALASSALRVAHGEARFVLTTSHGATVTCTFLIVATGLQEPVPLPSANGTAAVAAGLVHTYASAPAAGNGGAAAYAGKRVLIIGHGNAAFEFAHHVLGVAAYVHVAGRTTSRVKLALENHYPGSVRAVHAAILETYNLKSLDGITSAPFERLTFAPAPGGGIDVAVAGGDGCTFDAHGRSTSRCSFRRPYDIVVACLGWRFARDVFDADVLPALAGNGKHPAVTPRYEAVGLPGLFFAGTLAHAPDYKRSSGGFIHGFRYTARALHRILEEEEADAVASFADASSFSINAQRGVSEVHSNSSASVAETVTSDGLLTTDTAALQRPLAGAPPSRWPATRTSSLRALIALLLRRLNDGAANYQMFGTLCDVFVFDAPDVPVGAAAFVSSGVHAAMQVPWFYYDESSAAAAASDATGLAADVAASQMRAPPSSPLRSPAALASEAAVDAALRGALYEEVPVDLAPAAARAWAGRAGASSAEWLQVSLEFGPSPPPGSKDPFALDRADVALVHAELSHFIHPVLRLFNSAMPGCGDATNSSSSAPCFPVATLHVIEDFLAEWRLHTAHVLPLARFVQEVGARRAAAAAPHAASGKSPLAAPWTPATPPPPFLSGVLTQLASGCESATLYWGGGAFDVGGSADGWMLQLSVAAEAALANLRALAVHAVDSTPGVGASSAEAAHTQSVRDKWAAARAGGPALEELPRPAPPALSAAAATAAAAARAEADGTYRALTAAHAPGLGVLRVDARTGRCRVLSERLGLALGAVRVFEPGEGGAGGTQGAATSIDADRALSAAAAAPHIGKVFEGAARQRGRKGR